MSVDSVAVSASGGDVGFRVRRLDSVVGWLFRKYPGSLSRLCGLYDHKGTLRAYWHQLPTMFDKAAVVDAWLAQGESESCVEHLVPTGPPAPSAAQAVANQTSDAVCVLSEIVTRRGLSDDVMHEFTSGILKRRNPRRILRHVQECNGQQTDA